MIDQNNRKEKVHLYFNKNAEKAFSKTQDQFIITILCKLEIDQILILIKYTYKLLIANFILYVKY